MVDGSEFLDIKSAGWIKSALDNILNNVKVDMSHLVVLFQVGRS